MFKQYSLLILWNILQLKPRPASLAPDSFQAKLCRVQQPKRGLSHVAWAVRWDPAQRPRGPANAFLPEDLISCLQERMTLSDCPSSAASRIIGVPLAAQHDKRHFCPVSRIKLAYLDRYIIDARAKNTQTNTLAHVRRIDMDLMHGDNASDVVTIDSFSWTSNDCAWAVVCGPSYRAPLINWNQLNSDFHSRRIKHWKDDVQTWHVRTFTNKSRIKFQKLKKVLENVYIGYWL